MAFKIPAADGPKPTPVSDPNKARAAAPKLQALVKDVGDDLKITAAESKALTAALKDAYEPSISSNSLGGWNDEAKQSLQAVGADLADLLGKDLTYETPAARAELEQVADQVLDLGML